MTGMKFLFFALSLNPNKKGHSMMPDELCELQCFLLNLSMSGQNI